MKRFFLAVLFGAALAAPALGQSGPLTFKVAVKPALPPTPALKYTLLPELKDQSSGNALLRYYRGFSREWWGGINRQKPEWFEAAVKAQEAPLDKLPAEYAFVKDWNMLRELDRGARLDHCDWEMLEKLRREGFATLLPDLQGMREYAMYISLRARYELADGDLDKCVYTLQTGFALARHVGEGPTLIHMLVGVAISQIMARQLDDLIQHPKCPNLYWALARLPRPYIDLRRPFQGEMMMAGIVFPEFEELRKGPMALDQAQKCMDDFIGRAKQWGISNLTPQEVTLQSMAIYAKAKAALVQGGRPAAEVASMPVPQVLLLHSANELFRLRDDMFKWAPLPFSEAYPAMIKALAGVAEARERSEVLPMILELVPAVRKSTEAAVRADRRFAMLRVVEALRLYAAGHDGALPAKLSDITEVPIPLDPVTGKAFDYAVAGDKATITGAGPAPDAPSYLSMVYEVTLKK